ncbi:putative MYB DNA binding protein (Tbf1) [Fonsecaea pedrosoi]|nr:putative MYB DNA binding protein (Tbf1) [Fonsecaea pedrosoi]
MAQPSLTEQPMQTSKVDSIPHHDADQPSTPVTSRSPLASADVDDNPRSPKRRRLSTDEQQRIIKSEAEGEVAGGQPEPAVATSTSTREGQDGEPEANLSQPRRASTETVQQVVGSIVKTEGPDVQVGAGTPATATGAQDGSVATRPSHQQSPAPNARLDNLPFLDKQSSQLLTFLSRLTPTEAMGLSSAPNAPSTKEYAALRAAFDRTRRLLSPGWPFLSPHDLGLRNGNQLEIIRKANQAIFMSSIFTGEIGLRDMDRSFLAVFVPENGKLLKAQASMYLELKTQGFITAWRTGAAPPNVVMADLFGPDLDKALLARRPGTTGLAPTEQEFLIRLASRRDILQSHVKNNTLDQLPLKYRWEDFSREVSSYLIKHIENSSNPGDGVSNEGNDPTRSLHRGQMEGQFSIHGPPLPVSSTDSILSSKSLVKHAFEPSDDGDFVAQAARAAEIALRSTLGLAYSDKIPEGPAPTTPTIQQDTSTPRPPSAPLSETRDLNLNTASSPSPAVDLKSTTEEIPHASQTAPTSVLYERARLAATKASLALEKKPLVPSQRRPWTTEEENALMTGLDQVKGPHWSQILAMYGPGGTISEALKDRNQVQLKDKARNLKLFFLKSGIEVPYYLKYVTGDLKTRAPAQALRQEARERDRLLAEGDDAALDELVGDVEGEEQLGEDIFDSMSNQESPLTNGAGQGAPPDESKKPFEPSMADVEALIAKASASAQT